MTGARSAAGEDRMATAPGVGLEPVIGGNVYPKYTTRNPLARMLVDNFLASLHELVHRSGAREIHEIGCGEGFLTTRLAAEGYAVRGCDLSSQAIAAAERRAREQGLPLSFRTTDLYQLSAPTDAAELVLCCEVLEHLPDPERALERLCTLARPHLVVSVPREPLWRVLNLARGKYWADLGNTPGHLQHWSQASFLALLQRHVEIVELRTPLPWTMALCRVG